MFDHLNTPLVRSVRMSGYTCMLATAAIITLTGCATSDHTPVQATALGHTKEQIIACAGTPLEERQDGELVMLTYYKEASILEEAFPQAKSSFPKVRHGCRAHLGLKDNHVVGVEYQSIPESYQDYVHCEQIFERCSHGTVP